MNVSFIPTTKIDKDHPKDQIIGDLNLAIQTRRMTKISDEHAMDRSNQVIYLAYASKFMGYYVPDGCKELLFLYGTIEEEPVNETCVKLKNHLWVHKEVFMGEFKGLMHKRFQMSSMGELTFFLGLQVQQKEDGIFISQDKYVAEILKKFDFATVKTTSTPIETNKALVKDEEAEAVDVHLYRSMIGSLMYLTASRPDIMFAVCACARFQVTPKTSHIHAVKRIFRYLKGQPKLGLCDYAGASLDRKSTTGGCQFLRRRLISWQCKKQTIVANSTTEAEYVAAANCCGQVLWIQNQMLDYGFNFMNTKIYIDNESTICIVKNPVFHSKTKHIEIRHHFIRGNIDIDDGNAFCNEIKVNAGNSNLMLLALAKVKMVNGERQLQALVDKKTVIITKTSIRSDLNLQDVGGNDCLPTDTIFKELARIGGEDRMKLHELMNLCTKLFDRVLALETIKTTQALEIASLKSRVKQLEKKASKRTHKFKRLYRVGSTRRVESSNDEDTLIGDEVFAKNDMTEKEHDVIPKEVSAAKILTTAGIKILVSTVAPSTIAVTEVEITLAQTLADLKSAKSKVVIQEPVQSIVTTTPLTILKAKGVTFRDASETTTRTPSSVSSSSIKDKGKAKMVEPEVPLIKKDQIRLDEELARRLDAKEQEAARLERENVELQEQATLAKVEEWDNVQAMMDADFELCKRLQEQEQGELTIEEKSKLFMELMNERKRHFAKLRAEEKRRKPLTKEVKSSEKKAEGSKKKSIGKKRAGNEQKQESSKRQRKKDDKATDEHEEAKEDDKAEMKKHMETVQDKEEIAIDAIPLATKPPMIIEYKIVKEGQKGFYNLIRAYGSSKRYSSMIKMLQNIDREDLKTLWKLVKAKHGNTRPERMIMKECFGIQKMNNKFRGGLLGLKDFKMILRVTTAQYTKKMEFDDGANLNVNAESLRSIYKDIFDSLTKDEAVKEQGMALKNLIDEEEQDVALENLVDVEEQDLVAVDGLMDMIDFEPPNTCDDAKVRRYSHHEKKIFKMRWEEAAKEDDQDYTTDLWEKVD
ncbi:putative ribonuclease H-like domain-containing protein [Tanacetum coccineum]